MVGIRVIVGIKDLGLGLVSLSVVRTANLQETHAQSVRFWAFFLSFFIASRGPAYSRPQRGDR